MSLLRQTIVAAALLAVVGCKAAPAPRRVDPANVLAAPLADSAGVSRQTETAAPPAGPTTTLVHFQESLPQSANESPPRAGEIIGDVLSREWLQAEVEARNPSLEAMVAAWQAAAQRYPQQIALDDPMLMGMIAPESAASDVTETGYALQLNQKVPWFGKRSLRGASAAADADAAYHDAEDSRLKVRLAADMAFFEYFVAAKLIELNRTNVQLMEQFRETAQAKYRTNQVTQQDVLQAELELSELERRQLELKRMQQVAIARINTLLRRWPDAPLPLPPSSLDPPREPVEASLLWQTALQQRPDLAALAWRVQSEESALALAYKNYYPDFDVFARYDTFWQPSSTQGPLRGQVGVAMNLPVWREKLRSAVCEAQFRLNQRRAEFDQQALEIQYEVVSASQQVEESRKTVELYAQQLVPKAEQNVSAARSNYEVGKLSFIELATARRQLVMIYERQLEAIIAYHRRLAELDRAVGSPLPTVASNPQP